MRVAGTVVAVLGGDARMPAAAEALAARGAWVRVSHLPGHGVPPGTTRCAGAAEALAGARAVLLPVQAVGEDGLVYTEPPVGPLYIRPEELSLLPPDSLILAGLASDSLQAGCRERGIRLIEYRERDDFALYNAVPSAEGAIQMAMTASPLCLFDSRSLVLGLGRTGLILAQMLRGMGARVTVACRRESDLARAWGLGFQPLPWSELPEGLRSADFVFNTVPALVLTRSLIAQLPRHAAIIDLASSPGGVDYAAAAELGVRADLAPGLPGKVAPVTAGRILAELVVRCLAEGVPPEEPREGA